MEPCYYGCEHMFNIYIYIYNGSLFDFPFICITLVPRINLLGDKMVLLAIIVCSSNNYINASSFS